MLNLNKLITQKKPTRIIGIDPGSHLTGCAIIETQAQQQSCLLQTTIRARGAKLSQRLISLAEQLQNIIIEYCPDEAAIEQVFVKLNPQSALVLGHARGALLLTLSNQQIPIAQYAPRAVKKAAVGYGAATKNQIQQMMQQLFKLDTIPQQDAADAIAIALCHANMRSWNQKIAQQTATSDKIWI